MTSSAVGISAEQVRLAKHALYSIHDRLCPRASSPLDIRDHDLSNLYVNCFDLLVHFMNALHTEMFSTRSEILYWEKYHESSSWEKAFIQYNNLVFSALRSKLFLLKSAQIELVQQDPESILYYIESLRSDFNELAVVLSKLSKIASYLLNISQILADENLLGHDREEGADALPLVVTKDVIKQQSVLHHRLDQQQVQRIKDAALLNLQCFVRDFFTLCSEHSFNLIKFEDEVSKLEGADAIVTALRSGSDCSADQLEDITLALILNLQKRQTWSLLDPNKLFYEKDSFPLQLTRRYLHRPSQAERYFVRNSLCTLAGGVFFYHCILPFMLDTELLHAKVRGLVEFVCGKVTEHVLEPLSKLSQELFDTIRKRESIVTRNDLELSKQALERMLHDFSNTQEGFKLIFPNLSMEEIKGHLTNNRVVDTLKSIGNESSPVVIPPRVSKDPSMDELVMLVPSAEQALAALMREYEKELVKPIRGILFGSLFSAILIQMQKLKVHTEAAMLTMDQILASNELTIAATAALPALGLFGVLVYRFRSMFRGPSSSVPQADCLHLRMILADLDRAYDHLLWAVQVADGTPHDGSVNSPTISPLRISLSEPLAGDHAKARAVLMAEGMCFFHAKRLRGKLAEVLRHTQTKKKRTKIVLHQAIGGSKMQRQGSLKMMTREPSLLQPAADTQISVFAHTCNILQSIQGFCAALYRMIIASAPELPGDRALEMSLEADLSLLEAPFFAINPQQLQQQAAAFMASSFVLRSSVKGDHAMLWQGVQRKMAVARHMRQSYPWFTPNK